MLPPAYSPEGQVLIREQLRIIREAQLELADAYRDGPLFIDAFIRQHLPHMPVGVVRMIHDERGLTRHIFRSTEAIMESLMNLPLIDDRR